MEKIRFFMASVHMEKNPALSNMKLFRQSAKRRQGIYGIER